VLYTLGVVLFALGIFLSVCLHEAGHMLTAKAFGMKVTRYFAGFGPTLWSFRRGETEYGVKAIPAGGFVKIVGMTPLEDEDQPLPPDERHRAFWRKPLWQRTVVLTAGSATHFVLGFFLFWVAVVFFGVQQFAPLNQIPATIEHVSSCVVDDVPGEPDRACRPSDPAPAAKAGLRPGDVLTSLDGRPTRTYADFQREVRRAPVDRPVALSYRRDGREVTTSVTLVNTKRAPAGADPDTVERVDTPTLGVVPKLRVETVKSSPVEGIGVAAGLTRDTVTGTFKALAKFPAKLPKLVDALRGAERDRETPISVVGASRIGGEIVERQGFAGAAFFLFVLASLNIFIGIFNLFPLLPLDGGHVAIVWFERVRAWLAAKRGRPDPGRVDYAKLMPLTYAVVLVFGAISLLTIVTDFVNPVRLFQ